MGFPYLSRRSKKIMKTVILLLITSVAFLVETKGQSGNCGPMSYQSPLCAGSSTSISGRAIPGAAYYKWVMFGNAAGTTLAGQTSTPTNTLVTSSSQTGVVSWDCWAFTAQNLKIGGCSGAVSVYTPAATPSTISWTGNLCIEQAKTYTCQSVSASSYTWEVVETGFSQNTAGNSIYLAGNNFSSPGYYTLRVRANNPCGASGWKSVTIQVISGCPPL